MRVTRDGFFPKLTGLATDSSQCISSEPFYRHTIQKVYLGTNQFNSDLFISGVGAESGTSTFNSNRQKAEIGMFLFF